MPLVTYLHRHPRTGVYWFRRAVPEPLRAVLGCREITESLGTKVPVEAKRRLPEVAARAEARLEAARSGNRPAARPILPPPGTAPGPAKAPAFSWQDAERIAGGYTAEMLERGLTQNHAEPSRRSLAEVEESIWHFETYIDLWRTALRERDWSGVRDLALDRLAHEGIPVPDEAGLALLSHALIRALIYLHETDIARHRGEWPAPAAPVPRDAPPPVAAPPSRSRWVSPASVDINEAFA